MSENTTTAGTGISFTGLLTIVLIALKLTGYISWSWWWVFSPLWIGWLVAFVICVLVLVGVVIYAAVSK